MENQREHTILCYVIHEAFLICIHRTNFMTGPYNITELQEKMIQQKKIEHNLYHKGFMKTKNK